MRDYTVTSRQTWDGPALRHRQPEPTRLTRIATAGICASVRPCPCACCGSARLPIPGGCAAPGRLRSGRIRPPARRGALCAPVGAGGPLVAVGATGATWGERDATGGGSRLQWALCQISPRLPETPKPEDSANRPGALEMTTRSRTFGPPCARARCDYLFCKCASGATSGACCHPKRRGCKMFIAAQLDGAKGGATLLLAAFILSIGRS